MDLIQTEKGGFDDDEDQPVVATKPVSKSTATVKQSELIKPTDPVKRA